MIAASDEPAARAAQTGGRPLSRKRVRPPARDSAKSQRLEQAHQDGGHAKRTACCCELAPGEREQPEAQSIESRTPRTAPGRHKTPPRYPEWARVDSNHRLPACEADTLATELRAQGTKFYSGAPVRS